jgi:hypothetical protein
MGVLTLWGFHQHDPAPYEPQMNLQQFALAGELCYEAEIRQHHPEKLQTFGQDDASETKTRAAFWPKGMSAKGPVAQLVRAGGS